MRRLKLIGRYSFSRGPTLKAFNPRVGTSIIPLNEGDGQIFYQYLTDKIHSLSFEGSEGQLKTIIDRMKWEKGLTVEKMKSSLGRRRERLVLLHLKFPDNQEIRRLIKITG